MAVDERKQRIRRNMIKMWTYAAAAYAASITASVSVGFNPASLYEGGAYNGFWIDPSNLSSMRASASGTSTVSAMGDSVGYILEQSGAGGTFSLSLSRPVVQLAGGYPALYFNGGCGFFNGSSSTHKMVTASSSVATYVLAARWDSSAVNSFAFAHSSNGLFTALGRTAANNLRFAYREPGIHIETPITTGTVYVATFMWQAGGSAIVRLNGVQVGSADASTSPAWLGPSAGSYLGDNSFSSPMNGYIFQLFAINKLLSGAELANIETYVGQKCGVTI